MFKYYRVFLSALFVTITISSLIVFAFISCSYRETVPLRVITLEGTPHNRGLIHGQTLKDEIGVIIHKWVTKTEAMTGMKFDEIKKAFLNNTLYKNAILKWNPELMREVEGISKGAGIAFDTIFLFQIGEELESHLRNGNFFRCTSIGVNKTENSPCIVAQNMDPPDFLHGFPTLLHIKHDNSDIESYVFTSPGLIALNGINNKAIGIVANALPDLYSTAEGLPVAFIIRTVLEMPTYEEGVQFLHTIKHAKAQNYILGGPDEAICLECFDDTIAKYIPFENATVTYHTNNYLTIKHSSNSAYCSRLSTMREEIESRNYMVRIDDIKAILRSTKWNAGRPISHAFTYGSTIMELSADPVLYIAPDQPHITQYLKYNFSKEKLDD